MRVTAAAGSIGTNPDLWSLVDRTDNLWELVDLPPPPAVGILQSSYVCRGGNLAYNKLASGETPIYCDYKQSKG
eukprot:5994714-Pyramimonas_sp.AAC.1